MAIYTIFHHLQCFYDDKGFFPEKLYIQTDGGPENASATVLALCELLVVKKIIKSFVEVARLPVGHTHENIDALFGNIWTYTRGKYIHHPYEYTTVLGDCFASLKKKDVCIHQVFILPDYISWMKDCVDKHVVNFAKTSMTQLVFRFEPCEPCEQFPLGAKVT